MKLYPNRDAVALYVRSMGKIIRVTAIFDNDAEANAHMAKHSEAACVAVSGSLVMLADKYDPGIRVGGATP
jgi:hypothetical protein